MRWKRGCDIIEKKDLQNDMTVAPSENDVRFLRRLGSSFRFTCDACGRCCGAFTIILSPYDIFRLRKATRLSTGKLIEKGIVIIRRESFKRIFGFAPVADFLDAFGLATDDTVPVAVFGFASCETNDTRCHFLADPADGRRLCGIYEDRPTVCRLHPLGCVTITGRRRWFLRTPLCEMENGTTHTVKSWLAASHAKPFLDANVLFLDWMRMLLDPAMRFSSLPKDQQALIEKILYDFDSLQEGGKRLTWRGVGRMFDRWHSHLLIKRRQEDFPC